MEQVEVVTVGNDVGCLLKQAMELRKRNGGTMEQSGLVQTGMHPGRSFGLNLLEGQLGSAAEAASLHKLTVHADGACNVIINIRRA